MDREGAEHIMSFFADYMVLYLTNPYTLLSSLMSLIRSFGKISGLAINFSESKLHPIALSMEAHQDIQRDFNFCWVSTSWRH